MAAFKSRLFATAGGKEAEIRPQTQAGSVSGCHIRDSFARGILLCNVSDSFAQSVYAGGNVVERCPILRSTDC